MDAAALHLALCPEAEPKISARLVLRMGFTTLDDMARTLKLPVPSQRSIDAEATPVSVTYDDFVAATAALRSVDYPVTLSDEEAWPHFRGWRVNYDTAALALCRELDAPPSMWTGPRRWPSEPRAPWRPAPGRGRVRD